MVCTQLHGEAGQHAIVQLQRFLQVRGATDELECVGVFEHRCGNVLVVRTESLLANRGHSREQSHCFLQVRLPADASQRGSLVVERCRHSQVVGAMQRCSQRDDAVVQLQRCREVRLATKQLQRGRLVGERPRHFVLVHAHSERAVVQPHGFFEVGGTAEEVQDACLVVHRGCNQCMVGTEHRGTCGDDALVFLGGFFEVGSAGVLQRESFSAQCDGGIQQGGLL
jgi:hypothetical protein